MASNTQVVTDEDGSHEDWIELYNYGSDTIQLEGFGLSDDLSRPFKWVFPEVLLPPATYLLVWASGKNRYDPPGTRSNGFMRLFYGNIPGTSVNDLLNSSSFPDNPSSRSVIRDVFEAPTNVADNYGQHVFATIVAPQSGNYRFWISSDDNSVLRLSTDDRPDNLRQIASVPGWTQPREWGRFTQQRSELIALEEGQSYFISALMKEGQGGDNLCVRWQLPDGSIEEPLSAIHAYIEQGGLHTNFRISSSGEPLLLTAPDGTVVDHMPEVAIPTNISYGRVPGDLESWFFLSSPTPEDVNVSDGFTQRSVRPLIRPNPGAYQHPVLVEMDAEGATIRYTTDGSEPGREHGQLYTGPFLANGTVRIRAIAFAEDALQSEVLGATYTVLGESVQDFSSNLPIMVIHQFDTLISPGDRTVSYVHLWDVNEEGRTIMNNTPVLQSRVNINVRGSSSQGFPKQGFGFHILEEDGSNRKESLLGMPEEHNWVLHGPYSDKTLLRNVISYEWAGEMGHYAPRTKLIELFMHTGQGRLERMQYHGVYVLVERIKIAPGRLDLETLEPFDNEPDKITGAYIFKNDRLNPGEQGLRTSRGSLFAHVRPNEWDISGPQKSYLIAYLDSLETALFSNDFKDQVNGYAPYVDIRSFIDYHLITEACKEIDGYRLSTFLFKDRNGKLHIGPVWDYNLSLGNANYHRGWDPIGWYFPLISNDEYLKGWYTRMFQDERFEQAYRARYRQLRSNVFSTEHIVGKIRDYAAYLDEAQQRNFQRWDILGRYVWPNWFVGNTYQEEIDFMAQFIEQRLAWMDTQLGGATELIHYWNFNDVNDLLTPSFTLRSGSLHIENGPETEITSGSGQGFTGLNARFEDEAGSHLRINNPIGTTVDISLSSLGFEDIIFSYETRRSGSGANRQYLSYTLDGNSYLPLDTVIVMSDATFYTYNLAEVEGANNNPLFGIRIEITQEEDGTGGLVGNNRFDNITLDGVPLEGVNLPPFQKVEFPDNYAVRPGRAFELNLAPFFQDPDDDTLSFEIIDLEPAHLATAFIDQDNSLVVEALYPGNLHVRISVSDGQNIPLEAAFSILVYPQAAVIKPGEDYRFDHWDANQPDGTFPMHMIFLQSQVDDPGLDDALGMAYFIPESDYAAADIENIGFPYRNESRTRINGLGEEGISMINTGRGRDLGSAVLSIDSRMNKTLFIHWAASTLRANSRVYAMRLQYRNEIDVEWRDLLDEEGEVIEYTRNSNEGEKSFFMNLSIPDSLLGQDYLQLSWRYYFTGERLSESSGARDMIALHFIHVQEDLDTSVSDLEASEKLYAFPNPSSHILFFNKTISGWITHLDGRVLAEVNQVNELNCGIWPKGMYILRTKDGEILKLIVQ